jgi:hypothetical protein
VGLVGEGAAGVGGAVVDVGEAAGGRDGMEVVVVGVGVRLGVGVEGLGVAVGEVEVAVVEVGEEREQLRAAVVVVLGALGEGVVRGRRRRVVVRHAGRQRAHALLDVCTYNIHTVFHIRVNACMQQPKILCEIN